MNGPLEASFVIVRKAFANVVIAIETLLMLETDNWHGSESENVREKDNND